MIWLLILAVTVLVLFVAAGVDDVHRHRAEPRAVHTPPSAAAPEEGTR